MNAKNVFIYSIFFITLLSACTSNEADKDGGDEQQKTIILDDTSAVFETQDYHLPNELNYVKQQFDFRKDKFRPIGWSADGKLAYILEPADEASGNYFFDLFIQDMVSDKLLFEFRYNDQGKGENLSVVWDSNYEKLKEALQQYKIIQKMPLKLEEKSFSWQDSKYDMRITTDVQHDPDFKIDLVQQVQVFAVKDGKNKEILNHKTDANDALFNVTLPGVLLSPYEGRIAVILQEERKGYEGPPNMLTIRLVGASLNTGF